MRADRLRAQAVGRDVARRRAQLRCRRARPRAVMSPEPRRARRVAAQPRRGRRRRSRCRASTRRRQPARGHVARARSSTVTGVSRGTCTMIRALARAEADVGQPPVTLHVVPSTAASAAWAAERALGVAVDRARRSPAPARASRRRRRRRSRSWRPGRGAPGARRARRVPIVQPATCTAATEREAAAASTPPSDERERARGGAAVIVSLRAPGSAGRPARGGAPGRPAAGRACRRCSSRASRRRPR